MGGHRTPDRDVNGGPGGGGEIWALLPVHPSAHVCAGRRGCASDLVIMRADALVVT